MFGEILGGLVSGFGSTALQMQREQREKEDREKTVRLHILQTALNNPDLRPEAREAVFADMMQTLGLKGKEGQQALAVLNGAVGRVGDAESKVRGKLPPVPTASVRGSAEGEIAELAGSVGTTGAAEGPTPTAERPTLGEVPRVQSLFYSQAEKDEMDLNRAKVKKQAEEDIRLKTEQAMIEARNKAAIALEKAKTTGDIAVQKAKLIGKNIPTKVIVSKQSIDPNAMPWERVRPQITFQADPTTGEPKEVETYADIEPDAADKARLAKARGVWKTRGVENPTQEQLKDEYLAIAAGEAIQQDLKIKATRTQIAGGQTRINEGNQRIKERGMRIDDRRVNQLASEVIGQVSGVPSDKPADRLKAAIENLDKFYSEHPELSNDQNRARVKAELNRRFATLPGAKARSKLSGAGVKPGGGGGAPAAKSDPLGVR